MSSSLKAAEITVRVIVLVLQLLAIISGALVFGLLPAFSGFGGAMIGIGAIISIYEVMMISFALLKNVNHQARLVADIILNSVMAGITGLATLGVIIVVVILSIVFNSLAGAIAALFALPIGLGIIYTIAFIVSAVSSGIIHSKLANEQRYSALQSTPLMMATPPGSTCVVVPQPKPVAGQSEHPPTNSTSFGVAAMPVGAPAEGVNYNYPPGYPSSGNNFQYPANYGEKSGISAP